MYKNQRVTVQLTPGLQAQPLYIVSFSVLMSNNNHTNKVRHFRNQPQPPQL